MPGKKPSDCAWRYISHFIHLRDVTVVDPSLAAVTQMLDMRDMESAASTLCVGYENILQLAFGFVTAGTGTAEVWVEISSIGGTAHWHRITTLTLTSSQVFSLRDVPLGRIKVMMTALSAPVCISYAKSE